MIWYAIAAFLGLWGGAVLIWGLPGLFLPAVALVPVIFLVLLLVTRG